MLAAPPISGARADWKRTVLLGVVDLGVSNIGSVMRAFQRLGSDPILVDDPVSIAKAKGIVLPGVGAFRDGMTALHEKRLVEPIRDAARGGKPILGFCLGMQLLADRRHLARLEADSLARCRRSWRQQHRIGDASLSEAR